MSLGKGRVKHISWLDLNKLIIAFAICSGIALGSEGLFVFLEGDQQLEVIGIKWLPGPEPLKVEKSIAELSDTDLEELKALGLTGRVSFAGSSGPIGSGKTARALIILRHQIKETIELTQPDGRVIVYVQDENGFRRVPHDVRTLRRIIRLWPDEGDPARVTRYLVERAGGGYQGGTLFTW